MRGYSDKGGGGEGGNPRTVRVLTYADTLTRGGEGGRVVILVLYAYCQSYYGFQSRQLTKHGTTGHHSYGFRDAILSHLVRCIMRYTVYPCLVSCHFYAIPIYMYMYMNPF